MVEIGTLTTAELCSRLHKEVQGDVGVERSEAFRELLRRASYEVLLDMKRFLENSLPEIHASPNRSELYQAWNILLDQFEVLLTLPAENHRTNEERDAGFWGVIPWVNRLSKSRTPLLA